MDLEIVCLIDATAEVFGVSRAQLLSARRDASLVHPRHLVCWIARTDLNKTFAEIGTHLNRDYSTVIWAVQRVDQMMAGRDGQRPGPVGVRKEICRVREAFKARRDLTISSVDLELERFVTMFRQTHPAMRGAMLRTAVIDVGGMWSAPHVGYGDHEYSVSLYGVSATGTSEDELCLHWLRCALRVLEGQKQQELAS